MFTRYMICTVAAVTSPLASAASDGAGLYREHCSSCHGINLEGQDNWQRQNADGTLPAPPHDDSGHTWHHSDEMLLTYVRLGGQATLEQMGVTGFKSGMPGFDDILTDAEIEAVLGFIKSSWSKRMRDYQQDITEIPE